jgi:hypothetical protein
MGRPRMFDKPQTAAERMKRYRRRQKASQPQPTNQVEAVLSMTKKQQAAFFECSVRSLHYVRTIFENTLIKWDDDVINGKHGKVGMNFIAEVCVNAPFEDIQQRINDTIKAEGAAAGRALWYALRREEAPSPIKRRARVADALARFVREKRNDISARAIADYIDDPFTSVQAVAKALDRLRATGAYDRIVSGVDPGRNDEAA